MTDRLFFWRMHDSLTVADAAILLVGGNPGEQSAEWDDERREQVIVQKRDYPNLEAAENALKMAILRGDIEARIAYEIQDYFDDIWPVGPKFRLVSTKDINNIISESGKFNLSKESRPLIEISQEPDWTATVLEVESLRRWLRSKGAVDGFFVSADADTGEASFADPDHEHFSAELALAVVVWRSLVSEQKFPRGPKAAIETWIDANRDAWLGEGDLSAAAKERIATLVNWGKKGGAPSTGG